MASKKLIEKIRNMNEQEYRESLAKALSGNEFFDGDNFNKPKPKPKYKHKFITIKGHRRKDGTWVNSHVKRVRIKDKN